MESDARMELDIQADESISPYLMAIQSISGQSPAEKFQQLNLMVKEIVQICQETGSHSTLVIKSLGIPEVLLPLVQIFLGNELKSCEAVVEALKSSDPSVVNKAIRAKWFFDGSNNYVTVDYFKANILSFISMRTRLDIIKVLSRGLERTKEKAEDFFKTFFELYGLEQSFPFLFYCRDDFIIDIILKHKIVLPVEDLHVLYQKNPKLAVRYLHIGDKIEANSKDRKLPGFKLSLYKKFFPKLIKHYVNDYFHFTSYMTANYVKIGKKRIKYLFENAKSIIINKAKIFKHILPLKAFHDYLSKEEFEEMYGKSFPEFRDFKFEEMLRFLKYYPIEERLSLMAKKYLENYYKHLLHSVTRKSFFSYEIYNSLTPQHMEIIYSKTFPQRLQDFQIHVEMDYLNYYPMERRVSLLTMNFQSNFKKNLFDDISFIKNERLLKLLPDDERATLAARIITVCKENSTEYYTWCTYLPVEESLEIFKGSLKSFSVRQRTKTIKTMIYCCKVYNSQQHLLEILHYVYDNCKNEKASMLYQILDYFIDQFHIETLDDSNWTLLFKILQRAYIKDELLRAPRQLLNNIFHGALLYLFLQLEKEIRNDNVEIDLNKILNIYLEYKIELTNYNEKWTVLEKYPKFQKLFVEKCLQIIPQKYPEEHKIWEKSLKKIMVLSSLIHILQNINSLLQLEVKSESSEKAEINHMMLRIQNYPWLMKSSTEILVSNNKEDGNLITSFKTLVKENDLEFYTSIVTEPVIVRNYSHEIRCGKAWVQLKNDSQTILANWEEYLQECRRLLRSKHGAKAARRFILSTKWCSALPFKFIERCLLEIEEIGSLKILGLLLEGDALSHILSRYLPTEPRVNTHDLDARKAYRLAKSVVIAINSSNPPVPYELLLPFFQGEYIKLGAKSVTCLGRRLEKSKAFAFSKVLLDMPVSTSKHGVRLIFQIASIDELREFLTYIMMNENRQVSPTITGIVAKNTVRYFNSIPDDRTWALVEICIRGLKTCDVQAFKVLSNVKSICNEYAPRYITALLEKVEELAAKGNMNLKSKEKWIKTILENIDMDTIPFLPKQTVMNILRRYFFRAETIDISAGTEKFANKLFSRQFLATSKSL